MATLNLGRVGFVNKGTYSDTTPYKVNDVVIYNRGTYACIQANTGSLPTDIAYWQVWVENTAPSNTGEGATGTWNIDITGNASKLNNKVESIPVIANTLVERDSNGNINTKTVNISETATVDVSTNYYVETNNDGYLRPKSLANVKTEIAGDKVSLSNNETIGGVKTFTDGIVLQNRNVSPFSGFKNYIINGNFDIWQRGTSQTTAGYGSADRWLNYGSTATISRIASATGYGQYGMSINSSDGTGVMQRIESTNSSKIASKTVTLSVVGKHISGDTISASFYYANTQDNFSSFTFIGRGVLDFGTSISKKVVTINLPSNVINGLQLYLHSSNNLAGVNEIYQVQLEEGSVATPFENRPYGLELSLCQRYYWKTDNGGMVLNPSNVETNASVTIKFPVTMRVIPTEVRANGSSAGITKDFSWGFVTCPSFGWGYVNEYTVNAEL